MRKQRSWGGEDNGKQLGSLTATLSTTADDRNVLSRPWSSEPINRPLTLWANSSEIFKFTGVTRTFLRSVLPHANTPPTLFISNSSNLSFRLLSLSSPSSHLCLFYKIVFLLFYINTHKHARTYTNTHAQAYSHAYTCISSLSLLSYYSSL